MYVIGIDPGLTGAIALYDTDRNYHVLLRDMPVVPVVVNRKNRTEYDIATIWKLFQKLAAEYEGVWAVIERQLPGQGGKTKGKGQKFNSGGMAAFSKGYGYAVLLTLLIVTGIPYKIVMPATWKAQRLKSLKDGSDKEAIRKITIEQFPLLAEHLKRVKDHNRAEAAQIAAYGGCNVDAD